MQNKLKIKNNILTTEDVFRAMLLDYNQIINYSHYFNNDNEVNLTKLNKFVDYPHLNNRL